MTDGPDADPTATGRWRQRGLRGLTSTRDRSVRVARWLRHHWERLADSLQDETPARPDPTPPPPDPLVEQRDAPRLISVPAKGYVYNFHLRATFTWSSTPSLRAETLSWYAGYFMPHAIHRLTRLATDAARDIAPQRAAELETHLQRVLAAQSPWSYPRGAVRVTCEPDVAVRLDDRIRQSLQPHVDRLVTLDCELDEHLRQARHAERLSGRWAAILNARRGGDDTDRDSDTDEELAEARRHMLDRQRAAARWIDELLAHRHRPHPGPLPPPSTEAPPAADESQSTAPPPPTAPQPTAPPAPQTTAPPEPQPTAPPAPTVPPQPTGDR
ncbi:hypothetical protein ACIBTV_23935 [Micromonospora sp. NPDC049366]|uniref:hypothetical protein n=1 Tax=Micromonospora sp. NPDC049366 TaxID=3364271 RepID=UPI0037A9B7EB